MKTETDPDVLATYQDAVRTAVICARMLSIYDIPALLTSIDRAETVGPLLDPTLYRDKSKAMAEDKEVLRAALALRALGVKLAEQSR